MKFLFASVLFSMIIVGCGRTPVKVGNVDESKLVDWKEIRDMGLEKSVEKYLGKVITVTDLHSLGFKAKNEERGNACLISFRPQEAKNWSKEGVLPGEGDRIITPEGINETGISIFFNYGSEAVSWTKHSKIRIDSTDNSEIIFLPSHDFCGRCQWDEENDNLCVEESPMLKVTGRVIAMRSMKGIIGLDLIPIGYEY
ncbi:MAG: hypothetical protein OCC49_00110 [Fibrobacterales bacterium]